MTLAALILLASAIVSMGLLWRSRNRMLWRRIHQIEQRLLDVTSSNAQDFEKAFKQLALSGVDFGTRLPLAMPSQHGEDLLLWNFFGRKTSGFFVDVGGFDGFNLSNSYFFEAIGWDGLVIEAAPEYSAQASACRPYSKVVNVAVGDGTKEAETVNVASGDGNIGAFSYTGTQPGTERRLHGKAASVRQIEVPSASLNEILRGEQRHIDFISMDIEGSELLALKGFDLVRFAPDVLLIEDNSHGQDLSVSEYLRKVGYVEKFRRGVNVFYCKDNESRYFAWVGDAAKAPSRHVS